MSTDKNSKDLAKKAKRLGTTGRLAYFLSGVGVAFGFMYYNFITSVQQSDQVLKRDIDEIKTMIERQGVQGVSGQKQASPNIEKTSSESRDSPQLKGDNLPNKNHQV